MSGEFLPHSFLLCQLDARDRLIERMSNVLRELVAQVRRECPSLLNEDSGGDAVLSIEIDAILAELDGEKP